MSKKIGSEVKSVTKLDLEIHSQVEHRGQKITIKSDRKIPMSKALERVAMGKENDKGVTQFGDYVKKVKDVQMEENKLKKYIENNVKLMEKLKKIRCEANCDDYASVDYISR